MMNHWCSVEKWGNCWRTEAKKRVVGVRGRRSINAFYHGLLLLERKGKHFLLNAVLREAEFDDCSSSMLVMQLTMIRSVNFSIMQVDIFGALFYFQVLISDDYILALKGGVFSGSILETRSS